MILVVCNFNPVLRQGYCMGVPEPGSYRELFNTDDTRYGGTGVHNKAVKTRKEPMHGFEQSVSLTLPPLSTMYFAVPAARAKPGKAEKAAEKKPKAKKAKPAAAKK